MKYKFSRALSCLVAAVLICALTARPAYATGADAPPAEETGRGSQEEQPPEVPADGGYVTAQNWPAPPEVGADGVVLMDAVNGTVLYAKNADQTFYPASITKILTALLVIENCSLDETVTYSKEAIYSLISGAAAIGIVPGEEMSVEDSLYALLLHSANDAANGLAEHVAGSMSAFADLMNEKAAELGAKNTHFSNPSGLHAEDHYTTAYDMAMIMKGCIQNETFLRICSSYSHDMAPTNKMERNPVYTKHRMLLNEYRYEYYVAGKTGYTTPAGNTLVTYAEKGDMKLICVVLHCPGNGVAYTSTRALFDYGFDHFQMYRVADYDTRYTLDRNSFFESGNTAFGDGTVSINFDDNGWVILPSGTNFFDTEASLTYIEDENNKTSDFATVNYTYQGMHVGSANLKITTAQENKFDFSSHPATLPEQETLAPVPEKTVIRINLWYVFGTVFLVVLAFMLLILGLKIRRKMHRRRKLSSRQIDRLKFGSKKRIKMRMRKKKRR